MSYDSFDSLPRRYERNNRWEKVLLLGFLLCLLLGIGALATFFLLNRTITSSAATDPLLSIPTQRIAPVVALQQLAGDPAGALAYQTLTAGESAASHAITLFAPQIDGADQAAIFSRLGRQYAAQGNKDAARITLNNSRAITILSPAIAPPERSRQLAQVAEGFLLIDEQDTALDAARQAMLVAAQTPDLLPAQRQQLFAALQPVAEQLKDEPFSQQLADLLRNPFLTPAGALPVPQMTKLAERPLYDQPLLDAVTVRQGAARQLVERMRFTGGADIEPERQALAAALLREDEVRRTYYQQMQAASPGLGAQLGLQLDEYAWQALKVRIAQNGFGISLVPEWEAARQALLLDMAQQIGKIDVSVKALSSTLTDPVAQAILMAEGQQWRGLQAELGLFVDAPVREIDTRLQTAQQQLAQAGAPLALPIGYQEDASPPGFRFLP
ncbi:MAG: hypothetical protein H6642_07420 [Caldilineaceae bacterium]|nr:hypothetical protein [Caldilineaceae bacterium]